MGASAGVGRTLASGLAAGGHDLVVVSSDGRDIAATAADLSIRYNRKVLPVAADVAATEEYIERVRTAVEDMGGIDGLFFPVGAVLDDDDGSSLSVAEANWLTAVNFSSVVATVLTFLPGLLSRPQSCIVGFGSVAAVRGRHRNIVYAAAKRALVGFFESLRHRCAGSSVTVRFYVLGYMDTALAFGRPTLLPKGDPQALSARVIRDLGRDGGVAYYPRAWRFACAVLAILPWPVFKRLSF